MSKQNLSSNHVKQLRQQRGWSQDQLAKAAGISRAAVSAIEIQRLVPSVAAALALARVLDTTVEELFGVGADPQKESWAWLPSDDPCRFWRATVRSRILRIPLEPTVAGMLAHDGILQSGKVKLVRENNPQQTLVMASCDPAASLLASEYERAAGYRLLPLYRSSRQALDLLQRGIVDVAGIHLATARNEAANAREAKAVLGAGYTLLRLATWDEGLAVDPAVGEASVDSLLRAKLRWVGREEGAGARQCQDEILGDRNEPRHVARDHLGVAEAIRSGWADVGVCLRVVSDQAGLKFVHVRNEAYDLCFPTSLESDHRIRKLIEVLRSPALQTLFASMPGYELSRDVEFRAI